MDAKILSGGDIRFKQYKITKHAISRYEERTGNRVDKMLSDIDGAGLLTEKKNGNNLIKSFIRRNSNKGQHALKNKGTIFIVKSSSNVILTTMTMQLIFSGMDK